MNYLITIFSTRELSLLFWLVVIILTLFSNNKTRSSFRLVLKAFFDKKILSVFSIQVAYVVGIIALLFYWGLWDKSLLKDTIFWFFGGAVILFFTINKATDTTFFYGIIKESLKWMILIEFLINFYTFSFLVEFFLVPVITIVVLMQAVSETKKEYNQVGTLMKNILAFVGILLFLFVGYKTVVNYQDLFSLKAFFSFLLPIVLTLLLIPFLYCLALFMNYEILFVRVHFISTDEKLKKEIKKQILFEAGLNLNKLHYISKNINKFDLVHSDSIKGLIKSFAIKK